MPADLREQLTRMVVDGEWPDDFPKREAFGFKGERSELQGTPTYDDMATYCEHRGHKVSRSAIGRFGMRMRMLSRMREAAKVTREVMADLSDENASQTQKAVAEMITATAIEFVSSQDSFGAKEIKDLAKAMKDCTAIAINSDKYVREQIQKKVATAARSTEKKLRKAGVNRKLIQEIIDEHLGVVK